MSVQTDFHDLITNDAAVTAILGTRLYPLQIPQDPTLPAAAYQVIGGDGEAALGADYPGLDYIYQIRLVDDNYMNLITLKLAVMDLSGSGSGIIERCIFREGPDFYDPEEALYSKVLEAQISVNN